MKVYLGADHRGFELKNKIKDWLKSDKYEVSDMGAFVYNKKDDYTLYAEKVASIVKTEKDSLGILICGSGVGVDVVANKFDGVRASFGKSESQVKAGRHDDNMNILVLASDYTKEEEAKKMVKTFLKTKFGEKSRYKRRLADIAKLEVNN